MDPFILQKKKYLFTFTLEVQFEKLPAVKCCSDEELSGGCTLIKSKINNLITGQFLKEEIIIIVWTIHVVTIQQQRKCMIQQQVYKQGVKGTERNSKQFNYQKIVQTIDSVLYGCLLQILTLQIVSLICMIVGCIKVNINY
eukprot:TRINITY_DN9486_c0_g1_i1.p2 TRINITY_DN9486_c0_g1~~TRINITY_DN9486_c0_g1_i1.p2  ORF type:complete len:141 (-),score=0.15 TRINITY_DN9486_c0_g1_i1:75-497(-)